MSSATGRLDADDVAAVCCVPARARRARAPAAALAATPRRSPGRCSRPGWPRARRPRTSGRCSRSARSAATPTAPKLAPLIRAWPGESQHARAVLGLGVLGAIGTDTALMQLSGIAEKVKFKALQQRAREAMDEIAAAKGMTKAELEDRIVPDCGLDEQGSRTFDIGPRSFAFVLGPGMKPMVCDESGKVRTAAQARAPATPRRSPATRTGSCCASRSPTWPRSRPRGSSRRWSRSAAGASRTSSASSSRHPLQRHLARLLVWRRRDDDVPRHRRARLRRRRRRARDARRRDRHRAPAPARRGRARGLGRAARRLRDRPAVPAARPPGARRRAGRARRGRSSPASSTRKVARGDARAHARERGWQRGQPQDARHLLPARASRSRRSA